MGGGSTMVPDGKCVAFISSFVSQISGVSIHQGLCEGDDIKAVCENLVNAAGPAVHKKVYEEENRQQIDEWLSFASIAAVESCHDPLLSASRFATLNTYFLTRAVLLGNGTTISIADIATYVSLHESLVALPKDELNSYPNLIRWVDYVQNKYDSSHAYEWIPIEKSKFDPPVSSAEPISKKIVPSAEGPSAKSEGGSGNTVMPPPKQEVLQEKKEKSKAATAGKDAKVDKDIKEPSPIQKDEPGLDILDIRVGVIVSVKKHPTADTLYVEEIDLGESRPRQVVSGLAKYLSEDQMLNRRVLVLANVKPSKLRDVMSAGLVLCASNGDNSQCEPLIPPKEATLGERVLVFGYERKPEAVLNPKKKQWEKLYPDLYTDDTGVACFKGFPLMTHAGPCCSSIIKATIK